MKFLLDTHIWLWSLTDAQRISPAVRGVLAGADAELWLSPLSVWEATTAIERKRFEIDGPADVWLREALERIPVTDAPLTREVALAVRRVRTRHGDPVDRFLVATAQVFELTLVTADEQLIDVEGIRVLPNSGRSRSRKRAQGRAGSGGSGTQPSD